MNECSTYYHHSGKTSCSCERSKPNLCTLSALFLLVSCCRPTCCHSRCQATCQELCQLSHVGKEADPQAACPVILVLAGVSLSRAQSLFDLGEGVVVLTPSPCPPTPSFSVHSLTFIRSISRTPASTLKGGSNPQLPLPMDKGAGLPLRRLARVQIKKKKDSQSMKVLSLHNITYINYLLDWFCISNRHHFDRLYSRRE